MSANLIVLTVGVCLFCLWNLIQAFRETSQPSSVSPATPADEAPPLPLRARFLNSFAEPPKEVEPVFRSVMLGVCLFLLAWNIRWLLALRPDYSYDRYGNLVVILMLLFNHLAYSFRWPVRVTVALRVWAWVWLAFAIGYLLWEALLPPP